MYGHRHLGTQTRLSSVTSAQGAAGYFCRRISERSHDEACESEDAGSAPLLLGSRHYLFPQRRPRRTAMMDSLSSWQAALSLWGNLKVTGKGL